ncbi:glutathione S-transferase [Sphingomonas kyeonggiensis]|uniref:glutathione S-transferase n=1 Tax=Sphingomonas kyeonggiensis TaxID=1268553 RepID=UPI00277DFB84|nr:glutathione S-transferase [Sphingomonas kyeonggiensis]MDQ0249445.1 glutathione S-transferase [Sphingomonas kyeonggiensis]
MKYKLWYWAEIQGRGEFVRLPMEAAGIAYVDVAREQGSDALVADMQARDRRPPFAPPYLDTGSQVIAQVANILLWLGDRHGLAPEDAATRIWIHEVQLTVTDFVAEVHQVHHPVGTGLYYEDQRPEAARFAEEFREERMPKFLDWFERSVEGEWLAGTRWSYGDTSIFQLVEGLRYMFPRRMAAIEGDYPRLIAIRDRVADLPGIAAYLSSARRIPFNTQGIFRHYPELDAA